MGHAAVSLRAGLIAERSLEPSGRLGQVGEDVVRGARRAFHGEAARVVEILDVLGAGEQRLLRRGGALCARLAGGEGDERIEAAPGVVEERLVVLAELAELEALLFDRLRRAGAQALGVAERI